MATNSNNLLHDYGIQNEESDLRAHVCPLVRRVYVYPTEKGRDAVLSGKWPRRFARQPGVVGVTAEGCCIPPGAIEQCVEVRPRECAWDAVDLQESESTSVKGAKAVRLVAGMIRAGLLPLPSVLRLIDTDPAKAMQIRGDDIIVDLGASRVHVQVKCDFRGGDKALGGTGNLYLQVSERNPLHRV
jgi:hypothetical protein